MEEKIQKYKEILQILQDEQSLNEELIAYGTNEVGNLEIQRLEALDNMDFYATVSFDADSYTKEKKETLLKLISRCTQNGVEFPKNDNEAINIAAENSLLAYTLNSKMERLVEEMAELTIQQIALQDFEEQTKRQIKILTK